MAGFIKHILSTWTFMEWFIFISMQFLLAINTAYFLSGYNVSLLGVIVCIVVIWYIVNTEYSYHLYINE